MNKKDKKDYIDFETSELLNSKELKILVSNNTPLVKAELLANKLWQRIAIINDQIYIKHKETFDPCNIIDDNIHKYVSIMTRKLVDQSICKFINKENRDPYGNILKRKYYEDIIDDIEYMLMWDGNDDDGNDDDDEERDGIVETEPDHDQDEGNDNDDEDDTFSQCQSKVTVVDSVKEIIDFL